MIFISAPYSHPKKHVVKSRYDEICLYAAQLFAEGKMAVSPVIVGHNLLDLADLPSNFSFWKEYSFALIKPCTELHVLELEDWHESGGVTAEIIYAQNHDIDVYYIHRIAYGQYERW